VESVPVLRQDPIELARRNWIDAGWADAADGMAMVTSIMRVQQLLLGQIEVLLRPHGLTFARFEVLRLLAFTRRGELPVGKIGERLQVHPASVTNAVQRLEEAGLVVRRTNPSDRRGVLAEITVAGRSLVESCTALLNDEVFSRLDLSGTDADAVVTGLHELRRACGDFS
jgi:DNA-binding MarR family transcriptional regulator